MSYIYSEAQTVIGKPIVDDGKGNYKGECVSLVKKYVNPQPTSKWKMGVLVRGNNNIKEGTVIATFFDGKSYKGHAAFYVSQDGDGIIVVDQYQGLQKIQKRKIRFKGKADAKDGVNDGDSYYVVE
jgi:hypothetical protein